MRNLIHVIDQMLEVVPPSEDRLREALEDLRSSTEYSAPELMRLRWETGMNIMLNYLPNDSEPIEPWQRQVIDIWMDRTGQEQSP